MSHIRVLIRDAPTMLRDILEQAIVGEPDMEVVAESSRPPGASGAQVTPDVVVIDISDGDAVATGRAVLAEWPRSRVVTIRGRGQHVSMFELVLQGRDLGELSPGQLVEAIRAAVQAPGTPWPH
jgi:DNA-binding NarL/FixJ family response regulator